MKYLPECNQSTMFGLFLSLLVSLDRRGILSRADFTQDLDDTIVAARTKNFLAPSTLSDMERALKWLQSELDPSG